MASLSTYSSNQSLYVGDLHPDCNEAMLFDVMKQAGPVLSIRVCRDVITKRSLGYAYVNFQNPADAERALETLNYHKIKDKPIRLMWSTRDPYIRKSGSGNVFIKNLHPEIDNQTLYDTFAQFGNILSCKVSLDPKSGGSRGYGFVHFESEEAAKIAIEKVNGMLMNGNKVYVSKFVKRAQRIAQIQQEFVNCYVKNFKPDLTLDELNKFYGKFGKIVSSDLKKDKKDRPFGFINFSNHEEAVAAVANTHDKHFEELNGAEENIKVFCQRAQKKVERTEELRNKFKQIKSKTQNESVVQNLYVKNLDETFNDQKLKELFCKYGDITSCKVMVDDKTGVSKGFGFVCFKQTDSANKALQELNGNMATGKPLYVSIAQRKDVRRAALEFQNQQRRSGIPPGINAIPSYPVSMNYNQPQFFNHPFYAGNKLAPRGPVQPRMQFPTPVSAARGRGQGLGMPRGRGLPRGVAPSFPLNKPIVQSNILMHSPNQQEPLTTLVLAQMTPEQQKNVLGERLYSKISETHPEWAAKVTGMLLEMDISEQLNLLESSDMLKAKINEALDVLKIHSP